MTALILLAPIAEWRLDKLNLKLLSDTGCDDVLYKLIKTANKKTNRTALKLECSVKIKKNGDKTDKTDGRCTITLLLQEWNSYFKDDQDAILDRLQFSREQLNKILTDHAAKINDDTDIIFGLDGKVGKIYLDFNGSLVCYESTNKVKYYHPDPDDKNTLIVTVLGEDQSVAAKHIRCLTGETYKGYPVFWIGKKEPDETTYYIRPNGAMFLVTFVDILSGIGLL
jgi:hypothetical protein